MRQNGRLHQHGKEISTSLKAAKFINMNIFLKLHSLMILSYIEPEVSCICTVPFKPSFHLERGALDLCLSSLITTEIE
jgi:hypothetical protein